jgi:hypothetical protein
MAKRIILYNLSENMTDEKFQEYVTSEKGPLISNLPAVKKYELTKITSASQPNIPYKYVGIVDVTGIEEFDRKAGSTQEYQDFLKKFMPMVKDLLILSGEVIY